MSVVTFRTADGRVIKFTSKPKRKNPSNSKGYRAKSRVASRVDALDALRRKAKKRKASPVKRKKTVAKRKATTVKKKTSCTRKKVRAFKPRTVTFVDGRKVRFTKPAGCGKPKKARVGKKIAIKNKLSKFGFVKGPALKTTSALMGKKNGQVFKKGSNTYRMISYKHPSSGKLVRYALRVKASAK